MSLLWYVIESKICGSDVSEANLCDLFPQLTIVTLSKNKLKN